MELDVITSKNFDTVKHGFFSRSGGVSKGNFSSLNCGHGSDDNFDNVEANRTIVAGHLGLETEHLHSLHQIHSNTVITITDPSEQNPRHKADAMVSNLSNIGLGVLTADCAPVLFADKQNRVIGAAHAGWKGALGGVIEATIDSMVNIGAQRADIIAVIGPCIGRTSYEVGPEFVQTFTNKNVDNAKFFTPGQNGHSYFDLSGFIVQRLEAQQISSASWTGHCTYSNPDRFYSYRWNTHNSIPDYGRMISVITNG